MTDEDIKSRWAAQGFSCALWIDHPGKRWENFVHRTDERVMVLEGEMEFELDGEIFHPEPGEKLLIPAGVNHSVRNIGPTTARWLYGFKTT